MDKEKVLNLAKLARIELRDDEAESLTKEFASILDYVGEVKEVAGQKNVTSKQSAKDYPLRNILRKDREPHETSLYTKEVIEQAPLKGNNYIKVKKIL
ncbi:MAG: Asp-tRNA(Asn)/Glu-tRNA(Gln) amidotransferase subunit GatC [Patescibacteria group bacterium]